MERVLRHTKITAPLFLGFMLIPRYSFADYCWYGANWQRLAAFGTKLRGILFMLLAVMSCPS